MKKVVYMFAFVFISRFRWTMRNVISNSRLELLCRKDPEDDQTLNEMGFQAFRNKANVSVHFCL